MASALLEHLLCPVCLSEFSDPVSLRCQHTFCRECIKAHLATSGGSGQCPECRQPFTRKHIKANRTLSNVVTAAKDQLLVQKTLEETLNSLLVETEAQKAQKAQKKQEAAELTCPQHQEKLKLFCETDHQLVCVVCRDGSNHEGHKCKPVQEKAQSCKSMLREAVAFLSEEIVNLDYMIRWQTAEIQKTKDTSREWSVWISAEFEQLHQLLREKEQEVKTHLQQEEKRVLEPMQKNLSKMTQISTKDRNTEGTLRSALNIGQHDAFLQWWTTVGRNMVEEMLDHDGSVAEGTGSTTDLRFSSELAGLNVSRDFISLGPYETHLSFFVWRDLLRNIQPVPHGEVISLWDEAYAVVTNSGRSIERTNRRGLFGLYQDYRPLAKGRSVHQQGRHYFEVEMGRKLDWGVGVCKEFPPGKLQEMVMLYRKHGSGYSVTVQGQESTLNLLHQPWRIGVYLDCDEGRVAFYDADSLVQVYTAACDKGVPLSLCLSPGAHLDGADCHALTVCCYQPTSQIDPPCWTPTGCWEEPF
ncbi:tripartite motif containing 109 isoform X2 [Alosa sapidissima]|uniref:tripartite motif containing 109 isoform X2 n=1 Tax=Alosa sapidissima TaxID=34773 RepID=UPI001C0954D1|nr:tripartite motif containing 109 isoform X2 [Alosa sapidissima]